MLISVHTPTLPVLAHESFPQVLPPGSSGPGMVLNCQSFFPVRTSNARTRPLVLLCEATVAPSLNADPTITTSPATAGVECTPISPLSRSICLSTPLTTPTFKSTVPSLPNEVTNAPVFAFNSTSLYPVDVNTMRSSPLPSVQYERPRPDSCRGARPARLPSRKL